MSKVDNLIKAYNLDRFIGLKSYLVDKYFTQQGFKQVSCFNDYKYAWVNESLNISVIAKVSHGEDCEERVALIWGIEGIYTEQPNEKTIKREGYSLN